MLKPEAPGLDPGVLFAPFVGTKQIGLAVSGGPDSLALLLLAHRWAQSVAEPPTLFVYTLDHGLRSEAAEETRQVERIAGDLGLACRILRWRGSKPTSGLQEAARRARYRLIGDAMRDDSVDLLLTAHHADDQAETVLMRLAHGSGLDGLAGMAEISVVEGVRVGRPFLRVAKRDLEAFVRSAGLRAVDDPSNRDPAYERSRWRSLQPKLDELGLDRAVLGRLAHRAKDATEALEFALDRLAVDVLRRDGFGVIHLDREGLNDLPDALRTRLLARSLGLATGEPPHSLAAIERLSEQVLEPEFAGCTVSAARIVPHRRVLLVHGERGRVPPETMMLDAGEVCVWDRRFEIDAVSEPVTVLPFALTRIEAEKWLDQSLEIPVAALCRTPVVAARDGSILAIGTHVADMAGVRVSFANTGGNLG